MPGIKRRSRIGIVDFQEEDRPEVHYCPKCELVGKKVRLGTRIYLEEDKAKFGGIIPPDADKWLQCHDCGKTIPTYDARHEGRLKVNPKFETVTSKFDFGQNIMESVMESRRVDRSSTQRKSRLKKRRQQLDAIEDPDVRAELRAGSSIENYSITKL